VKKKVLIPLLVAVPLAGVGATVLSADAATTPAVSFTRIYFDSPGTDDRSNTSLNKEYVRVRNNTSKAIPLKGWTIRDRANHVFTFKSVSLGSGQSIYVHTGKGTDGKPNSPDRYWQSGNYIWNNTGDGATLKNASAKTIDTCVYTATQDPATNC
jgi:hypothetical protein